MLSQRVLGAAAAILVIAGAPTPSAGFVEGQTPAPFDSFRVFGDGVAIGNTLMENPPPNLQVNTLLLDESSAQLTGIPDDAVPQAVYVWWSGNLANGQGQAFVDDDALFVAADGASTNLVADQCRFMNANFDSGAQLGFYYCRADVTAFVTAHPGAFHFNGTYTVGDVIADPGRINPNNPLACHPAENGLCQAKYAAWSMVFVYDSPTETLQRDVILYDGFVHLDETATSLGFTTFNIGGFEVGTPPAAEITYFGLEGDQQLGAGPGGHCEGCPDFFRINGLPLTDGFNPSGNIYNSSDALGLDIDEFNIGSTGGGLGILDTGDTSASITTGAGDNILGPFDGDTGESVFLGWVFLRLNRPSPDFRGSATTKIADPPEAATGETIFYSVNVANQGSLAATGTTFTDTLPTGVTYQPGSLRIDGVACTDALDADPCRVSAGTITVNIGTLPATGNNDRLITFRGTMAATAVGSQVCNVGTVTSNETPTAAEVGPACTTLKTATLGQPTKTDADLTGGVTGPDDVVQYTIVLPGDPTSNVSGVTFEDDVPAHVQLLGYTSPGGSAVDETTFMGGAFGNGRLRFTNVSIPAGGVATVTVTVQVDSEAEWVADGFDASDIHGQSVCNQGRVSAGFIPAPLPTNDPATVAAQDPTCFTVTYAPIFATSNKAVVDDDGGLLEPGDTLTYTINLRNTGNRIGTIDLTDHMPPGVEGFTLLTPLGSAAFQPPPAGNSGTGLLTITDLVVSPGATTTIRFRLTVRADAPDGLVIQNSAAIVVAERPEENRTLTSPPLTVVSRPDLTNFTKTVTDVNGAPAVPGDTLSYTLSVSNTGNRAATSVVITDVVPVQLDNVVVTSGGGTFNPANRTITWNAASLAVGATLTVSFTARIIIPQVNGTVISNQAFIDSAEAPPAEPSNDPATAANNDPTRITVVSAPDLGAARKTVVDLNGGGFAPGDLVEYTLTVDNTGTAVAANVVVRDTVETANLTDIQPLDGGTLTGAEITWNLGAVAPGQTRTVRFRARIRTPLLDGTVVSNQGRVTTTTQPGVTILTDDPGTAAVDDPTRFTVDSQANFTTSTIAVVDENGGAPQPGDAFLYTVTVVNTGDSPATTVVTTVPAHIAFSTVTPLDGGVFNAMTRTITWTLPGPLAPGTPVTQRFRAVLAPATPAGTQVCEAATIDSVQSEPFTTPEVCFVVVAEPDLSPTTKTVVDLNGGEVRPGDVLAWTITVRNQGAAAAPQVVVTDVVDVSLGDVTPQDGGLFNLATRTITWTIPALAAGAETTVRFTARVNNPLDDGTVIANQASLVCTGCVGTVLTDDPATAAVDDPTEVVVGADPILVVSKTVVDDDGGLVEPGDALTWTIVVDNQGDSCADQVVVVDPIDVNVGGVVAEQGGVFDAGAGRVTWNATTTPALVRVCPGAANAVTLRVRTTIATPLDDDTAICDQVSADSDELLVPVLSDDPGTATAGDPTCVAVTSAANLDAASKTVVDADGAPLRPGDALTYTISFTNTGNANAVDVTVSDPIDASLTDVVPGQGGQLGAGGGEITWNATTTPALALVAPGQTITLTFTANVVTPLANGTVVSNQALIAAEQGLPSAVPTDDPSTAAIDDPTTLVVVSAADVQADKTVVDESGGIAAPGDVFVYTVSLENLGDAVASSVVVADVLDANLQFVDATAGGSFDAGTRTITWLVGDVVPGTPVIVSFRARAASPLAGGTVIANQATHVSLEEPTPRVSDDPSTAAPDDPTLVTIVAAPVLTGATKTVSGMITGSGLVTPGTVLTYELSVTNEGDAPATAAVIRDPVDTEHLDQITPQDGGVFDAGSGTITWTLGTLAPGETRTVRFTARVRLDVTDGQVIENQGQVTSLETPTPELTDDPEDPEPGDPTEVVADVNPRAELAIAKTVADLDGGTVQPGDTLRYTLVVDNRGGVAVEPDARLFDPLPPHTAYVPGSTTVGGVAEGNVTALPGVPIGFLSPGETVTVSFDVVVTATAVPGTVIANQATASDGAGGVFLSDDPATAAPTDPTSVVVGGGARLDGAHKTFDPVPLGDDGDGVFEPGERVQFRISVQNAGDAPARAVIVRDAIPAGSTYVPGTLALGGAALTDAADGDAGELAGSELVVRAGDLAPGAVVEVGFQVEIAAGASEVVNQALIDSDDTPPEPSDADGNDLNGDQPTRVPVGDASPLRVEKAVQDTSGGVVSPGDVLLYTIRVSNDGATPIAAASLRDEIPAGTTYVGGSTDWTGAPPDPFVPAEAALVMNGLALEPGETATITFRVTVDTGDAAPADGEVICNTVEARATAGGAAVSDEACVTVGRVAGTASFTGRVYVEVGEAAGGGSKRGLRGARAFDGGVDEPLAGVQVLVRPADAPGAPPVAGAVTDTEGRFRADGLPPGVYDVQALSPRGTQWALVRGVALGGDGGDSDTDVLVAPTGRVHDATSGAMLAGARVQVFYDDDDPVEPGALVPADRLGAGQQDQLVGPEGIYRLDLPTGRPYRLAVTTSLLPFAFPSQLVPPSPGEAGGGPVVPDVRPSLSPDAPRTWFRRILVGDPGAPEVTNNHIPLDPLASLVRLDKRADRPDATLGEIVTYTITVQNRSSVDFDAARPLFVRDVPARGLSYLPGHAVAQIARGASITRPQVIGDARGPSGDVRFGPFEVPAGATLTVVYQVVVGVDTREGVYANRAVAVDCAGAAVSNADTVELRVKNDPVFDEGLVIGRVVCDADRDGRADGDERGVMGARIYADTGSYAITDAQGRWHLSAIDPGLHMFKLDRDTLPPGARLAEEHAAQLVHFTRGFTTRIDFAVDCAAGGSRPAVTPEAPEGSITLSEKGKADTSAARRPAPRVSVTIAGDLGTMAVQVDGKPQALPSAGLELVVDPLLLVPGAPAGGPNLVDVPDKGWQTTRPVFRTRSAGLTPAAWTLVVSRVSPAGTLSAVRTLRGQGAPGELAWDGLDDDGKPVARDAVYVAHLRVRGAGGVEAASARVAFGVAWGVPESAERVETLRGDFFTAAKQPKAKAGLKKQAAALAARIGPEDTVVVEVHADGTGDKLARLALTQKQADVVRELLIAAGIPGERVKARGRGSMEPVAGVKTRKDKAQNRRVVVRVTPPPPKLPGTPVPNAPAGARDALVQGEPATLDAEGRFVRNVPIPADGRVLVDLQGPDGRRVTAWLVVDRPRAASARPDDGVATHTIAGDAATGALSVDGAPLPAAQAALAALDVGLEGPVVSEPSFKVLPPRKARTVKKQRLPAEPARLDRPLRFTLGAHPEIEAASWSLLIWAEGAAQPLHRLDGRGLPPPVVEWNGTTADGKLLAAGRYRYRLRVDDGRGGRGESAEQAFWIGPAKGGFKPMVVAGKTFTGKGEPGARLKNQLARFKTAMSRRPAGETYRIEIAVAPVKGVSATDLRLAVATRQARLGAYLARLKVPEARVEIVTRLIPADAPKPKGGQKDVVTITAKPPAAAGPPRAVVLGGAATLTGTSFETEVAVPPDGVVPVELVRPSGQRVRWHVRIAAPPKPPAPAPASPPAPARPAAPRPPTSLKDRVHEDDLVDPDFTMRPAVAAASSADGDGLLPPGGRPVRHSGTGRDALLPPEEALGHGPTATLALAGDDDFGDAELGTALADPDAPVPPPAGARGARATTVRAANLAVDLPPRGLVLAAPDLWVGGTTDPSNRVFLNGREVPVGADGRFDALLTLPVGASTLVVEAVDTDGNRAKIAWPVAVAATQHFLLVLADGAAGTAYSGGSWSAEGARIDGMTDATTTSAGPVLFHGRVALYYKGRVPGGSLFKKVNVTGHLDTARRAEFEALDPSTLDPDKDYAVYGDTATEVRDAKARGKLYVLVEADDSKAIVGNFKADLRGGELLRYDRTVYGAGVDFVKSFGVVKQEVRAFASAGDGRLARDVNVFRATGGSLYYLRHGRVTEGGERVRVIVRDRDSGLVLFERAMTRDVDYVIDEAGGRLMFKAPIPSTADGAFALDNLDAGSPLGGHPVYVEVDYEYEPDAGEAGSAAGVYARDTFFDIVSVGAGILGEGRSGDSGLDDYSLAGADVTVRHRRSSIRAEIARSESSHADHVISMDGGLSFQGLNGVATTTTDGGRGAHAAWKIELDASLGDFAESELAEAVRVRAYAQSLDRGFFSGGTILEQGREKYGVLAAWALSKRDTLTFRHDTDRAQLPRIGPDQATVDADADPLTLDTRISRLTTLKWARAGQGTKKALGYGVELTHHAVTTTAGLPDGSNQISTNRYGIAGTLSYRVSKRFVLRAGQDFQSTSGARDPVLQPVPGVGDPRVRGDEPLAGVSTSVGWDWELAPGLHLGGDFAVRWNGDTAAQLGFKTPVGDSASMYVTERFEDRGGRLVSTSIVGAEDTFGEGGRGKAYGEYQLEAGVAGQRNRAVLGLGHRWQPARGVRIHAGFEHQQTVSGALPDGTPTGRSARDVLHAGLELIGSARWKASANVEVRFDEGQAGIDPRYGNLTAQDPRVPAPPGTFPDHGGAAPGSPLVIPTGRRVQVVAGAGASWKWSEDQTFLARFRLAHTEDYSRVDDDALPAAERDSFTAARYLEATAGWAFRPLRLDWLDLLVRYSYLLDLRPLGAGGEAIENRSHVAALVPLFELPWNLRLSSKLAWKRTASDVSLGAADDGTAAALAAETDAFLALARLSWRFAGRGKWGASWEYRVLRLDHAAGGETLTGSLVELDYDVTRWVRLGIGWNFSHFSDDELGDLARDTHGFFVRVVGRF